MRIGGSTVLVTGASSGIGADLAPQLAERGATVGIVARRADRLEQVLEQCRRHAPESRMWAADLGDLVGAEAVAIRLLIFFSAPRSTSVRSCSSSATPASPTAPSRASRNAS